MGIFDWLFGGGTQTAVSTEVTQGSTQTVGVTVSPKTDVDVDIAFDFERVGKALESWAVSEKELGEAAIKTAFLVSAAELELQQAGLATEKEFMSFMAGIAKEELKLSAMSEATKNKYLKLAAFVGAAYLLIRG